MYPECKEASFDTSIEYDIETFPTNASRCVVHETTDLFVKHTMLATERGIDID